MQRGREERGASDGGVSATATSLNKQPRSQAQTLTLKYQAALPAARPRQLLRSFPTFTLRGLGSSRQVGPGAGGPRQQRSPLGGRSPRPWAAPGGLAAPFVTVLTGVNTHRHSRGCFPRLLAGTSAPAAGPRAAPAAGRASGPRTAVLLLRHYPPRGRTGDTEHPGWAPSPPRARAASSPSGCPVDTGL